MGQKDNDKNISSINNLIEARDIKCMIYTIRGHQVMLDSDLANLYMVETKRLNERVKGISLDFLIVSVFNFPRKNTIT